MLPSIEVGIEPRRPSVARLIDQFRLDNDFLSSCTAVDRAAQLLLSQSHLFTISPR
jgi:hypothetical protein